MALSDFLQESLSGFPERMDLKALLLLVGGAWFAYRLLRIAWNLSPFHPLSRIPGPRLAAATYLPEFYHDAIRFGRYTQEIQKMHQKYGPIVRINPDEVHCADSNFIEEIYAVGNRKRNKPAHQVSGSTLEHAGFATADHDWHKLRRVPMAKFFSRSQILKLEHGIHELVQRLCDKLLLESGQGPVDLAMAYSCFTSDVIAEYTFGQSFGFLAQKSWEPNYRRSLVVTLQTVFVFRFFPFLKYATYGAPWLSAFMSQDMALLIKTMNVDIPNQIRKGKADRQAGIVSNPDKPTVFEALLDSDLPEHEKTITRLANEGTAVMGAGTETTSWTLSVITFYLLTQPAVLARLTEELRAVVSNPHNLPPWSTLEALPYLGAVVHEGLRLSYGVSARTARVPTGEDLLYRGEWTPEGRSAPVSVEYVIPRGYAIGMSSPISHHDEAVWPDSHSFIPERWLDNDMKRRKELERCLLSFSKGSRSCLGMNLAFCELYLLLAAITLRVLPKMHLYETTELDVKYDHDMFIPCTYDDSKGVRVTIK